MRSGSIYYALMSWAVGLEIVCTRFCFLRQDHVIYITTLSISISPII